MKRILFLVFIYTLIGCHGPSSIKVQNNLSKTIIRNAEWGGVPISSQLMPGETSAKIKIYDDSYYDIDLPEKHPLKFYIDVNGDKVYLETKELIELGIEDDLLIEINDSTEVINPILKNK
jgi:hypothetical protein